MHPTTLIRMIGRPSPPHVVIVDAQDTSDIMRGLIKKHKECTGEYDRISQQFAAGSLMQICERLFNYCKQHLKYKEEGVDSQYLSAPQTILSRGHSDCKGYALFIGGVLDSLKRQGKKITWLYRFASYEFFRNSPGHVFVVVETPNDEIWIDPVMDTFNYHQPYWSATDRRVHTEPVTDSMGCACQDRGLVGSISQTGTVIMKLSPTLAYIPVVGWIAAAAGEVIGGIISIIGSHWNQSPDVRWLAQLFEFYALNNKNATSDNKVNEADVQPAQAFFSVVLGVPIGGRKDFNILQSGDGNTNTPTAQSATQRATNYLIWKNLVGKISMDQAVEAATIAATLNPSAYPAGGWAGLYPAPSTINKSVSTNAVPVSNTAAGLFAPAVPGVAVGINPLWFVAAAAAAYYVIK